LIFDQVNNMRRLLLPVKPQIYQPAKNIVYRRLRDAITRNQLMPSTRLRIEVLAKEFGVSPMPVREALIRLHAEGLVVSHPNRGAVVAPLSTDEIRHLYEARSVLEGYAAGRAAARATPRSMKLLRRILGDMGRLLAEKRYREYVARNRDFHDTIHEACGNPRLIEILRGLWEHTQRYRNLCGDLPEQVRRSYREHRAIVAALQAGRAGAVERIVHAHVLGSGEAVASHVERLTARETPRAAGLIPLKPQRRIQ
jgi:DNA-binding GntR family transcriptional regulator